MHIYNYFEYIFENWDLKSVKIISSQNVVNYKLECCIYGKLMDIRKGWKI